MTSTREKPKVLAGRTEDAGVAGFEPGDFRPKDGALNP